MLAETTGRLGEGEVRSTTAIFADVLARAGVAIGGFAVTIRCFDEGFESLVFVAFMKKLSIVPLTGILFFLVTCGSASDAKNSVNSS